MTPLPRAIRECLSAHHVLGLAVLSDGEPWSASCFYACVEEDASLLILSDETTRHGAAMLAHPQVAGTIAGQPAALRDIRGLQFRALAARLEGAEADDAFAIYCRRHPIARLKRATIWRLQLLQAKHTDNAIVFGMKTEWSRTG